MYDQKLCQRIEDKGGGLYYDCELFMYAFQEVESDSTEPVTPTKESSEDGPEEEPPSVPSSPSGVNRRTSVLFTKKAGALFKVCTRNTLLCSCSVW